jgi:YegS/Rv2252/BmrU family lipid kinase
MRVTIIHNPVAGGPRRRLRAAAEELAVRGVQLSWRETGGRGDAEAMAADLNGHACDRLVVAGGDGTVNEVVNGLGRAAHAPPLAIVPMGTANVLACEIGLALSPSAIARAIVAGPVRKVALGQLNDRRFVLMAGVGFDAAVVAHIDLALKRRLGKAAYVAASLGRLAAGHFGRYRIVADGREFEARSAVVARARHYGGPWIISREAGLERPQFRLCLYERGSRADVARYALALMRGKLDEAPGFRTVAASSLTIEGAEGEPIQADGDIVGTLPAKLTVLPGALDVVYPAAA